MILRSLVQQAMKRRPDADGQQLDLLTRARDLLAEEVRLPTTELRKPHRFEKTGQAHWRLISNDCMHSQVVPNVS